MDTEGRKKTSASSHQSTEESKAIDIDLDPFVSQVGATNVQDVKEDWVGIADEFDEMVSAATEALFEVNKIQLTKLQTYFEKASASIPQFYQEFEFSFEGTDHRAAQRFVHYVPEVAKYLAALVTKTLQDDESRRICFTALEYQSFRRIKRAIQPDRASSSHTRVNEAPTYPRDGRRNSSGSDLPDESLRRRTYRVRDQESEDLRRELARYYELPPPWNQQPAQCPRQDRLDVSKLIQLAGDRRFRGSVEEYPRWRSAFIHLIGDVKCLAKYKVNALMSSLEPILNQIIDFVPFNFDGYKEIVCNLEKMFGGSFRQLKRFDEYFDASRKIQFGSIEDFRMYVRRIAGYRAVLLDSGDREIFTFPLVYRRMISPLPGAHIRELQTWMFASKKRPCAESLIEWASDRLDQMLTEAEVDCRKSRNSTVKACIGELNQEANETSSERNEYDDSEFGKSEADAHARVLLARPPEVCMFGCDDRHPVTECRRFLETKISNRKAILRGWKYLICYSCLKSGHTSKTCRMKASCNECGMTSHHTLLHEADKKINDVQIYSCIFKSSVGCNVILPYIEVRAIGHKRSTSAFAFIDSGANVSIISKALAAKLELQGSSIRMKLDTAGGIVFKTGRKLELTIGPLGSDLCWRVSVFELEEEDALDTLPKIKLEEIRMKYRHLSKVPELNRMNHSIDLLLGSDLAFLTTPEEVIVGSSQHEPIAERSKLGWSVRGRISKILSETHNDEDRSQLEFDDLKRREDKELKQLIEFSWILFDPTGGPGRITIDVSSEEILRKTMRISDGLVEAGILWKGGSSPRVPMNREMAV